MKKDRSRRQMKCRHRIKHLVFQKDDMTRDTKTIRRRIPTSVVLTLCKIPKKRAKLCPWLLFGTLMRLNKNKAKLKTFRAF